MPENKIARICWNTNHWVSPSGRLGKSSNKKSFEHDTGFGHEEWTFDTGRVINGYIYGFLQQFNNKTNIHRGNVYNINLYSIQEINSYKKKRWWLGKLNSVEVISEEKSTQLYDLYKEYGWLAEMEADLKRLNLDVKAFNKTRSEIFFNIRYRFQNIRLLDEPTQFEIKDPAITAYYYKLLNYNGDPNLHNQATNNFNFKHGHNPGKIETIIKSKGGKKDKSLFHNKIQSNIYLLLENIFGKGNVGTENDLGYQTKVDIVARTNNGYIFYEIKTTQTAKSAIREAFGQILEYSYWPDNDYANKLVIISPASVTDETKEYLSNLRRRFKIPIFYQQYDTQNNKLESEI